jgi:calmodulin
MQRTYIEDAFRLIDEDQSELINLNEIKRVVNSVGDANDIGLGSDDKISDLIEDNSTSSSSSSSSTPKTNFAPWRQQQDASTGTSVGRKVITKEDFFGLMAESETYQLFIDTFETLDPNDSGFVRAADLDRILCGVRDLISDDRKSIIDVDDMEMMVDYEQFSRMLLGTALKI